MKKNIIKTALIAFVAVLLYNCEDVAFSDDSDINLPASTITEISNETPFVGTEIILKGTNLNYVTNVSVGASEFKIIKQSADNMTVEVPRQIESGDRKSVV